MLAAWRGAKNILEGKGNNIKSSAPWEEIGIILRSKWSGGNTEVAVQNFLLNSSTSLEGRNVLARRLPIVFKDAELSIQVAESLSPTPAAHFLARQWNLKTRAGRLDSEIKYVDQENLIAAASEHPQSAKIVEVLKRYGNTLASSMHVPWIMGKIEGETPVTLETLWTLVDDYQASNPPNLFNNEIEEFLPLLALAKLVVPARNSS